MTDAECELTRLIHEYFIYTFEVSEIRMIVVFYVVVIKLYQSLNYLLSENVFVTCIPLQLLSVERFE